jgi:spore coat protein U-like protein
MLFKSFHPVLLALVFLPGLAWAQSASTTLTNTSNIEPSCQISVGSLNFGPFNPLDNQPVLGQAVLRLRCTIGSFVVKMNAGQNANTFKVIGDTYNYTRCQRVMKSTSGNFQIAYDLYYSNYDASSSASFSPVLDTNCNQSYGGTLALGFYTPSGADREVLINGVIRNYPADQSTRTSYVNPKNAKAGVYTDSVTVQITY